MTSQNRSGKRQHDVQRLRAEGRPVGPAPMGFTHRGARGRRYLVPDPEAQEIARKIVAWRDAEGLSWDNISDRVDLFLAERHDRPPTPRHRRPSWTPATCWRHYRRQKELAQASPPGATHRRCSACNRSLPLDHFARHGRYRRRACFACQAVQRFAAMEAETRRAFVKHLRELARLGKRDRLESPRAEKITAEMQELFANDESLVGAWHDVLVGGRLGPKAILGQFELIVSLLRTPRPKPPPKPPRRVNAAKAKKADEVDLSRLSNRELEEAIEDYKRRNNFSDEEFRKKYQRWQKSRRRTRSRSRNAE